MSKALQSTSALSRRYRALAPTLLQSRSISKPQVVTRTLWCCRWPPSAAASYCKLQISSTIIDKSTFCTGLTEVQYERLCDVTLEALSDRMEALVERDTAPDDCDVTFSSGVLTVQLGQYGTYVINKQTPNKQIWLSSPTTGPKRYDYLDNTWVYKHDGVSLVTLLNAEFSEIFNEKIDFSDCVESENSL